jgi:hypothetical protein
MTENSNIKAVTVGWFQGALGEWYFKRTVANQATKHSFSPNTWGE